MIAAIVAIVLLTRRSLSRCQLMLGTHDEFVRNFMGYNPQSIALTLLLLLFIWTFDWGK
jgi:hypothetical protein